MIDNLEYCSRKEVRHILRHVDRKDFLVFIFRLSGICTWRRGITWFSSQSFAMHRYFTRSFVNLSRMAASTVSSAMVMKQKQTYRVIHGLFDSDWLTRYCRPARNRESCRLNARIGVFYVIQCFLFLSCRDQKATFSLNSGPTFNERKWAVYDFTHT